MYLKYDDTCNFLFISFLVSLVPFLGCLLCYRAFLIYAGRWGGVWGLEKKNFFSSLSLLLKCCNLEAYVI